MSYKLFKNCIPVNGACRSIIIDLHRKEYKFIPNALFKILSEEKIINVKELVAKYGIENEIAITEYVDFLIEEGFVFEINKISNIIDFDHNYISNSIITNAIIEISTTIDIQDYVRLLEKLDSLNCNAMELRICEDFDLCNLEKLLISANESRFKSIEVIDFFTNQKIEDYLKFAKMFDRIVSVILHNAFENKILYAVEPNYKPVILTSKKVDYKKSCGKISPNYFIIETDFYLESLKFNTCLNKKVCVDKFGFIKNCNSSYHSFGNISSEKDLNRLREIVLSESFTKYWTISKDKIEVCKDCEFRYICSDCRVFIENSSNPYSKPSKCTYNPYIGKWEEQLINK